MPELSVEEWNRRREHTDDRDLCPCDAHPAKECETCRGACSCHFVREQNVMRKPCRCMCHGSSHGAVTGVWECAHCKPQKCEPVVASTSKPLRPIRGETTEPKGDT